MGHYLSEFRYFGLCKFLYPGDSEPYKVAEPVPERSGCFGNLFEIPMHRLRTEIRYCLLY